jgi:hypothetical protein
MVETTAIKARDSAGCQRSVLIINTGGTIGMSADVSGTLRCPSPLDGPHSLPRGLVVPGGWRPGHLGGDLLQRGHVWFQLDRRLLGLLLLSVEVLFPRPFGLRGRSICQQLLRGLSPCEHGL